MRLYFSVFALSILSFCLASAQTKPLHSGLIIEQPAGPKPWTNLEINDKPGQFQFVVVTDRTGGNRPGIFEKGVEKINLLQPEFVMSVGDLIHGYTTDTIEINRQWDEFDGFVNKLDMPFFYVPGNHDLTNPVMAEIWKKRIGPTHYSFVYQDVLFMALNSEDQLRAGGKGSISAPQYEWIKKTLEAHPDVKWTFLFMHQPLWVQDTDPVMWFDVEKLLAKRKHTVFAGHRHSYQRFERNNTQYYMLATMGGGSAMRGPRLGEFDHFTWVTMTDRGPILANLQLDGVFDHDVFNEELAAFTRRIWNADMIQVEPLYVADAAFRHDSVRFRLTNPFDVPVKVKIDHRFSWDFKADIARPELVLPPNSVEFISMELTARKQKPLESMKAVEVDAEVAVQELGRNDYFVPIEFNVAPLVKYELKRVRKKIKADGKLNDWPSLPYALETPEGANFGIVYDDEFVYIGVQVNDSELINDSKQVASVQDYVGVALDAQPMSKSVSEKGEGAFKNSLYFWATPEDGTGQNSVRYLGDAEEPLEWKCVPNKDGYALEVAIPMSYVHKLQGEHWQTLRLNVLVQDKDAKSSKRATWMPVWNGPNNIPGSGMLFRTVKGKM